MSTPNDLACALLYRLMGEHDFTLPHAAFAAVVKALAAASPPPQQGEPQPAALAQTDALQELTDPSREMGLYERFPESPGALARKVDTLTRERDAQKTKVREVLNAERALSDSYLRIRLLADAMNPPTLEQEAFFAYVESKVADLRRERDEARAALPLAPLTDSQIEQAVLHAGGRWNGDWWIFEDADLHPFVRGIAAISQGTK